MATALAQSTVSSKCRHASNAPNHQREAPQVLKHRRPVPSPKPAGGMLVVLDAHRGKIGDDLIGETWKQEEV